MLALKLAGIQLEYNHWMLRNKKPSTTEVPQKFEITNYSQEETSVGGLLGSGAFSQVYQECSPLRQSTTALKVLVPTQNRQPVIERVAMSQVKYLKRIDHPNIVRFLGSWKNEDRYFIRLQKIQGKNLRGLLRQKGKLTHCEVVQLLKGLLNSLHYLHQHNIMHRDLKPENIFFNDGEVKLIDFGCACDLEEQDEAILEQTVGTKEYKSPQILESRKYNSKSDIWSLGIILYQVLYGKNPWQGKTSDTRVKNIKNSPLLIPASPVTPQEFVRLLEVCLKINPRKRIDWETLKEIVDNLTIVPEEKEPPKCSLFKVFS